MPNPLRRALDRLSGGTQPWPRQHDHPAPDLRRKRIRQMMALPHRQVSPATSRLSQVSSSRACRQRSAGVGSSFITAERSSGPVAGSRGLAPSPTADGLTGDTGGMTSGSLTARDLLAGLLDPGTFRSWDTEPADGGPGGREPGPEYAADLARARARTGVDESVLTGEGLVGGHPVAVAASEFGFLGGSIGVAAGERLTRAGERATAERRALIALPASGGTRMQEGTLAFLQMGRVTGAVTAHRAAHLPYLVYLRHPSTGGVFASWASLGHLTLAEPGALIGFLGPRVYEALEGKPFSEGVQTAENLTAHGLVDAVVAPDQLGGLIGRVLDALTVGPTAEAEVTAGPEVAGEAGRGDGTGGELGTEDAWASVQLTRRPDYPDAR